MSEGKIIQFPVDRIVRKELVEKGPESPVKKKKYNLSEEEKKFLKDKCEQYLEKVGWVIDTIHALKMSSPGAMNLNNIQKRRELVRGISKVELMDIIIDADETKIKQHPSYYAAVMSELESGSKSASD